MEQQQPFRSRPFVISREEFDKDWETIDADAERVLQPDEWEPIDATTTTTAKPFSWANELGLNEPTDSRMVGFLRGAGGAAVDMVQGAAAPTSQMIYQGGDLIRRNLGMNRIIDKPEVQAAMTAPDSVAGKIGEYGPAVAALAQGGAQLASKVLPNVNRAKAGFQTVMQAAREIPLNLKAPGDAALRISELSERGGTMPKAVRDFLKYATDPNKPQMTYEVARDFASNISRLSANEYQRLTPVMAREVANLRVALNESVAEAAKAAGKGAEYKAAMREYANAMRLRDAVSEAGRRIKTGAPIAAAGGGAYWLTRKVLSLLSEATP